MVKRDYFLVKDSELVLKVADCTDDILSEIISQSEIKNIDWDMVVDEKELLIEISIEDLGSNASIKVDVEKEDLFCAAMSIKRDSNKSKIYEMSGLIAATILNNLAIAGINSLVNESTMKNKISKFFDKFKEKEEDI